MHRLRNKYFHFRVKIMLLYPLALALIIYYRWIAPLFGRAHVESMRHKFPRLIGKMVLRMNHIKVKIEGAGNLNSVQGFHVLFTNHNSRFDAYILLAICPFPFKSFWSNGDHVTNEGFKFITYFGRVFDMFFVHDKENIRRTVAEFANATSYLKAGGVVSFFPEGQFSGDGAVSNFGTSCVSLARRGKASIVPIVMFDTKETFESGSGSRSKWQHVRVLVLPPVDTVALAKTDVEQFTKDIASTMNDALTAPPPLTVGV